MKERIKEIDRIEALLAHGAHRSAAGSDKTFDGEFTPALDNSGVDIDCLLVLVDVRAALSV